MQEFCSDVLVLILVLETQSWSQSCQYQYRLGLGPRLAARPRPRQFCSSLDTRSNLNIKINCVLETCIVLDESPKKPILIWSSGPNDDGIVWTFVRSVRVCPHSARGDTEGPSLVINRRFLAHIVANGNCFQAPYTCYRRYNVIRSFNGPTYIIVYTSLCLCVCVCAYCVRLQRSFLSYNTILNALKFHHARYFN